MGKNFAVNSKTIPHPLGQLNLAAGTMAAILDYPKFFEGTMAAILEFTKQIPT
jgi:hypothetical protein